MAATPRKADLGASGDSAGASGRARPATGPSELGDTCKKTGSSILGMSLGRTLNSVSAFGGATAGDDLDTSLPATPGRPPPSPRVVNSHEVSKKIARHYASSVRDAENQRLRRLAPIASGPFKPDEKHMSRSMKKELDIILNRVGTTSGGVESSGDGKDSVGSGKASNDAWDKLLTNDNFQKKMQFLTQHARTGHFVEQYGGEGRYEGDFLYGMRHGKGTHTFRGEVYDGEWKWDQRHGNGSFTAADGSQIIGEWEAGKPHGYTQMIDKKGDRVYEGVYKSGKRHGLGMQIFESGDRYDGNWYEGKMHDRGVYYFSNGDKFYGQWSHGKYDGIGVFHYADGSISRRTYKDGLLMSVQDYEHTSQRFGRNLTRQGMQTHTADAAFPKEVFLLSTV